jgi:hypothetical protein
VRWLCRQVAQRGQVVARLGVTRSCYVADVREYGRLWVDRATKQAYFAWHSGVAMRGPDARKFAGHTLAALVAHARGHVALHGACVQSEGRAVAWVGRSGSGKSTMAAAACRWQRASVIADDIVAFELGASSASGVNDAGGVRVRFHEDHAWLGPASRGMLVHSRTQATQIDPQMSMPGAKTRVRFAASHAAPRFGGRDGVGTTYPLHAVVVLQLDDRLRAPRLTRLDGHDAFYSLFSNVHRLVLDDPRVQRREMDAVGELVSRIPVYAYRRPRALSALPEQIREVWMRIFAAQ